MYSQPERFSGLRMTVSVLSVAWMIGGLAVATLGILGWPKDPQLAIWMVLAGGASVIMAGLATVLVTLLLKIEAHSARQYDALRDLQDNISRQARQIEAVAENTRISDAAKSVAHREQELSALREALRAEIRMSDWEAATRLVDEMERRFGYRQEAESFRDEIQVARADAMHKKLDEAAGLVGQLIEVGEWTKARRELDRLEKVLPDEPQVAEIAADFHRRREACKQGLLKNWADAVRRDDIDEGIGILKQLDLHLTRDEARSLETEARELFKEKREQLGVQFRFAVKERRWRDALEVGVQLVEEFPNTRMAHEVSEHIDGLRRRAGLVSDVEVVARNAPAPAGNP